MERLVLASITLWVLGCAAAPQRAHVEPLRQEREPPTSPSSTPPGRPSTPEPAAPTTPSVVQTPSRFDLGALPQELTARWPTLPRTTRTVVATDDAALRAALAQPQTHVRFVGRAEQPLTLEAADIDLELAPEASLGVVRVERGNHRVRIRGGRVQRIVLAEPAVHWPQLQVDPSWFVEDVTIDGVTITHPEGGIEVRGRRVAVLRCRTNVREYSIWSGGAYGGSRSEDLIIAGNHFFSAGPEATVRVHDATSVIVVGNTLVNGTAQLEMSKHNLRFHGRIDQAYAARNTLVYSGIMAAIDDTPDDLERLWIVDNTFYQLRPSLLDLMPRYLEVLTLTGNTVHSSRHTCLYCGARRDGWVVADNTMSPYEAPPQALLDAPR